jgi:hypothetical protein
MLVRRLSPLLMLVTALARSPATVLCAQIKKYTRSGPAACHYVDEFFYSQRQRVTLARRAQSII